MREIVLTNDDGVDAPGLRALTEATVGLGDCRVVAPRTPQSGVGHRLTTKEPLTVTERGPGRYEVDGTPADCARLAIRQLSGQVDWLLAGINHGGNLGADFYPSGTIAAAREAALLGCPSISVSQYVHQGRELNWESTARRAGGVIRRLLERGLEPGHYWNVNLPHPEDDDAECEIVFCPLDPSPFDVRFREEGNAVVYDGSYFRRPRRAGYDVDVCFSGKIAVSLISLDINPS
ncbi:MAG: 5'/3'-nucleotidase SurE [Planctomycetota bacterium]|nr:5'/3'-nucleotidase SurE [Planctomycetota bacterium]